MRASPPIEVVLRRFGVWRGFVLALVVTTGGVVAAWILLGDGRVDPTVSVAVVAVALAAAVFALPIARPPVVALRWNGSCWQLGNHAPYAGEPVDGDVSVAIDLGRWMLLRFVAEGRRGRVTWLPVQRRGLEAGWHGLRCALYSPRPAPATP